MSDSDTDWSNASRAALTLALGGEPQQNLAPADIVRAAEYHGLACEAHQTAADLGFDALEQALRPRAQRLVMQGMRRFGASLKMLGVLEDAGIRAVGIKGIGLAAQTREVPMGRPSADVDLLIDPEHVIPAHQALRAAGGRLGERFPVPAQTAAFAMVRSLRQEAGYAIFDHTLDLHWQLGLGRHLLPSTQDAIERAVSVAVGGTEWPTLSPPDALVHSTVHWRAAAFQRLKYVLDIEALAAQVPLAEQRGLPMAIREILAVSHGLATSDENWRPRSWVPERRWRVAVRSLSPPVQTANQTHYRFLGFLMQFQGTPGVRDRAMIPVRAIAGPLTRQYERVTGIR